MRHPARLLCTFVLCAASVSARAGDWASDAGDDKSFAASKALCVSARKVTLPQASTAPKGCDPADLYYGMGVPADPAAARACALSQIAAGAAPDDPIDANGILATIYANGRGAPRDLDVAIAFACHMDGAPAEMDGRINHLAKLKTTAAATPFDVCDDATSGLLAGACAARDAAIADGARSSTIARLTARLTPPQRAAFQSLQTAERTYATAVAENEVDASGTLRGAMATQAREDHERAFLATLTSVLSGKAPPPDAGAARDDADRLLNVTYNKIMGLKDTSGFGTVTKAGIKATQRIWLTYRNAFLSFAKVAAPDVPPEALATELTVERTKDLAAFLE